MGFLALGLGLFIFSRAIERVRETQKPGSVILHFVGLGVLLVSVFSELPGG